MIVQNKRIREFAADEDECMHGTAKNKNSCVHGTAKNRHSQGTNAIKDKQAHAEY